MALNEGKCHCFYSIGDFLLFNLEGFMQFFKPNNAKSNHLKLKLLLLSCRKYLALETGFCLFDCLFGFFSPNLKFSELLTKRSQNLDFFSKKSHFWHFFDKNSKHIRVGEKQKRSP